MSTARLSIIRLMPPIPSLFCLRACACATGPWAPAVTAVPRAMVAFYVDRQKQALAVQRSRLEFQRRKFALETAINHRQTFNSVCSCDEMLQLMSPVREIDVVNTPYDGRFTFARVRYATAPGGYWYMGLPSWAHGYPMSEDNLMRIMNEVTNLGARTDAYNAFTFDDPQIGKYPIVYLTEAGWWTMTDREVEACRAYLLKGGFLWVDDFWGTASWQQWTHEIKRVMPEYQIIDIPLEHPIRHTLYDLQTIPQVTAIQNWRRTHDTRERGDDSPHANFRGMVDDKGRILVVMTHNTDIGDSWEREGDDPSYFASFGPAGYALGINAFLYGLTH